MKIKIIIKYLNMMEIIYLSLKLLKEKSNVKCGKIHLLLNLFMILLCISTSYEDNKRIYLNNYISEISLVVKGTGTKKYLSENVPSEVIIDGIVQKSCNFSCKISNKTSNVVLKFNKVIKSCQKMFYGITTVTNIDLSKFDFSEVTDMSYMFRGCTNLVSVNFGNIKTQKVKDMQHLFYNCKKLVSLDLSKFDTSKVSNFRFMFSNCSSLVKLDLSKFNTKNVIDMSYMFKNCIKLVEINLSSFDTSNVKNMSFMFYLCQELTNLNLSSFKTKNVERMNSTFSHCYKLEYLNLSHFDSTSVTTVAYMFHLCKKLLYLNLYSFIYKSSLTITRIFRSVPSDSKFCIKDPTTITKLLGKNRKSNCCDICFSENPQIDLKNRQCTQTNINNKNKFCDLKNTDKIVYYEEEEEDENENEVQEENEDDIENEEDEKKCKYFNDNINKCFENITEGYYFDPDDGYYKNCYQNCKKCNISGDEINNNCLECITNLTFLNDSFHIMNCYENCQYYYYFNYLDEYICTLDKECPLDYNKLIKERNECVEECQNDEYYKYEFNNTCHQECPNGTSIREDDEYICYLNENINNTVVEKKDKIIENFKDDIMNGKMDEILNNITNNKEDFVQKEDDVIYQLTTSENQKNNSNKNISTLDLGDCEEKLRKIYDINKTYPLIILKIDYYSPDTLIPIIGYEIYHPLNKSKLDLKHCEDILIKLNIPVSIDEEKLYKYDPNSDFYKDDCFSYTTENGTDIILSDRKKEFSDNKLSLCENNCNYTGYDTDTKKSACDCNVKNKMDLISEIINDQNKLSNNFDTNETSSSSSVVTLKCTKTLFTKEGLKNNISSYILLIIIFYFTLCIILFIKCGYPLLNNDINDILKFKEKIEKENKNQMTQISKKNTIKKSHKKKRKSTKNFPPKKRKIKLNRISRTPGINLLKNDNSSKKSIININTKKNILNLNNTENHNNKKFQDKNIKIEYTNYELNTLDYNKALLLDKRTLFQYYCALLRKKHPILFGFCPMKDYNSMIIKSSLFFLSFAIYYAINLAFFNEDMIHKIYENGGKYEIKNYIFIILISFAISYVISRLIIFIFLSERNLMEIKNQKTLEASNDIVPKVQKNLVIKYIIYFILGLIFLAFFWLLLSSFGAVYQNTQIIIFKNALISFGISLIYPIIFNIFPSIFRILSLNSESKDMDCMYSFSKIIQHI